MHEIWSLGFLPHNSSYFCDKLFYHTRKHGSHHGNVVTECRLKVMQKTPVDVSCITFNLHLASTSIKRSPEYSHYDRFVWYYLESKHFISTCYGCIHIISQLNYLKGHMEFLFRLVTGIMSLPTHSHWSKIMTVAIR